MKSLSILLVDDHLLFRKGIAAAINDIRPDWAFSEAANGAQALEQTSSGVFDIALVDVQMPIMGGIEFTRRSKMLYPNLPVLILTQFDEPSLIVHFLQIGVNGFLCKNSEPIQVVEAIETILHEGRYVNDTMIRAMETSVGITPSDRVRLDLSPRDKDIILLLRQGKNSKQIASLLHLSETSIESYRKDLLHKTQTRNVAELVSLAHRTGII
ncbi:MAG: response regulator transcription factor [Bacteroidota bacterium]